jgi:hypothetical protein
MFGEPEYRKIKASSDITVFGIADAPERVRRFWKIAVLFAI